MRSRLFSAWYSSRHGTHSVGVMGIIYRVEKRVLFIEPDSLLMIVGYVLGMWLLYQMGG